MKEVLRELLRDAAMPKARNVVREYLQAQALASLQREGAMIPLAFLGGTALRFLYSIRRYSEDLDFSLERPGAGYDFARYLERIRQDLRHLGYEASVTRVRAGERAVHSAFIAIPGLLHELRLSGQPGEALSIRLEVDTRPPAGAGLATTLVRRHELLNLQHHDRASLLAGKLHAVLMRPYPKGRDFYDLVWYLSDPSWPSPNLGMLNNALAQTGWAKPALTEGSWRGVVAKRVNEAGWRGLAADVSPFLETAAEAALLSRETLKRLLAGPAAPTPRPRRRGGRA